MAKKPLSVQETVQDIGNAINILNNAVPEDQHVQVTTSVGKNLEKLVLFLRESYNSNMPVRNVNDYSHLYQRIFIRKLIEDKTIQSTMSYDEFLVHVHQTIAKAY
jgi:hypothetical protein